MSKGKTTGFEEEPAHFIEEFITTNVTESLENRLCFIDDSPIFEEPLVGFADGEDPLFHEYKKIIGLFHLTPREVLEQSLPLTPYQPKEVTGDISVICWALPIAKRTIASNARKDAWPSLRWSHSSDYGKKFNLNLMQRLVTFLNEEGCFAVAPMLPLAGLPGGGIGYGFSFTGITSIKSEFKYFQKALTQSLESLTISQSYIENCIRQQEQQYQGILKAGKTLSETSDIIMDSWEYRNKIDDIILEKRSDAILGNERVYDPGTETIYEVPLGFYENYNLNREQYNMDNLQALPDDDWNLWTAPTQPGDAIN